MLIIGERSLHTLFFLFLLTASLLFTSLSLARFLSLVRLYHLAFFPLSPPSSPPWFSRWFPTSFPVSHFPDFLSLSVASSVPLFLSASLGFLFSLFVSRPDNSLAIRNAFFPSVDCQGALNHHRWTFRPALPMMIIRRHNIIC